IVPARTGRLHLQAILHQVVDAPHNDGTGATDLGGAISNLGSLMRRRGLAVVVSDWITADGWELPLSRLAARHDVLAVEVVDPPEHELPKAGLRAFAHPGTGSGRG